MSDLGKKMGKKTEPTTEKMGFGEPTPPRRMELTGMNAIVEPGGQIFVRLLPGWDIKYPYLKGNGLVSNPAYDSGPVYFEAWEHWWDEASGLERRQAWCLRVFDNNAACPLCETSLKLGESPDPDDRRCGLDLARQEVFLFNAVAKDLNTRRCATNEAGKIDIQVLCVSKTLFLDIYNIMTGVRKKKFPIARITNPKHGYDIKLTRPANSGDGWKVACATEPSPTCPEEEWQIWADWPGLLIDLPQWVASQMKSYEELHRAYFKQYPLSVEMDTRQ